MLHLISLLKDIQRLPELKQQCKLLKIKVKALQIQNEKLRRQKELLANRVPPSLNTLECNTTQSMNAFYSDENNVNKYNDTLRRSVNESFLELIVKKIKISKNTKVLDAGCGLGILTKMVQQKFHLEDMSGFDFSKVAIKKAGSKYKNINFFVHNIYNPLKERYDVIICTETIEHLTDPEKAVHNLLLALNPQGTLFLTVPDGRIDYSARHINFWSPESWKIYLKKLSDKKFAADTGVIQYPTKVNLRYNWAILTFKKGK
mgnify:CR=1 FL=1